MRKIIKCFKTALILLCALACTLLFYAVLNAPAFFMGNSYAFYLSPNSSSSVYTSEMPARDKLLLGGVAGESTLYEGDFSGELLQYFEGEVLFTETASGVTNYYCFSPRLQKNIQLNGKKVNLHIAVGNGYTAVGTPIIFGGF